MKFSGKPILVFLVMLILAAPVFAIDIKTLQSDTDKFAKGISESLPFNSTIGLNWSDAYIGGFRHFGVGFSTGLTTMKNESINNIMDLFGIPPVKDLPLVSKNSFPLPAYTIETRIGVPVVPVDIGVKVGYLGQDWLKPLLNIGIRNLLLGADVRYVIVNSKVLPMRLSVGLGFNYLSGGLSYSPPSNLEFSDSGDDLTVEKPEVGINWRTTSIELKVQASFPYKIITPYAGAGLSYAWSRAGYEVTGLISDLDKGKLKQLGIDVSKDGFEKNKSDHDINTRVFAGFSINIVYVRLDLTAMYEILNKNFGATLGLRFQM